MRQSQTDIAADLTRALAQDFRLLPLDDPDRPVFLAVALPVQDGVTGLKPRLPAGRGLTPLQARLSAGAEAVELRASLAQRHDLSALPRRDGLAFASARDLMTGQEVAVPAQEIWLDCAATLGEAPVHDANSTGCAAGRTRLEATEAALRECIERDALALWWHGGLHPLALPLQVIDRLQPRLLWWLTRRDRLTRLYELTTDIGLPVVAAVSSEVDGRHVALGSAARTRIDQAALAAVTEMVQTEVSMEAARMSRDPEVLFWDDYANHAQLPQFRAGQRRIPEEPDDLLRRLADLGLNALAVDLTLPDDPLPTMRVLVPGLCAMGGRIDTDRFRRLFPANPPPSFPEPY